MNQTRHLAFAVAYGIAAGYLFTLAIGHMLALWPANADIMRLTIRIGAIVWIALIMLSAWVGGRLSDIPDNRVSATDARRIQAAVIAIGFVSGIVVADSLLVVISLLASTSIRTTRMEMLVIVCLAWLVFGVMGSALLSILAGKHLKSDLSRDR